MTVSRFRKVLLLLFLLTGSAFVLVQFGRARAESVAPLHLNVNSLADAPDTNAGDGICDSDGATAGAQCTLRAAIQEANAFVATSAATIEFDPALNAGTISLNTALPELAGDLIITGPGANLLRVQRNPAGGTPDFRIFKVDASVTVTISGLTIANGNAAGATSETNSGGGLRNAGTLTIDSCVVSGNHATSGGGIINAGTLTIVRSTIANNTTTDSGAGLSNVSENQSSSVTIDSSTISDNTTATEGGGIFNLGVLTPAFLVITNSTISSNHAVQGAGVSNHGWLFSTSVTIAANDASNNSGGIRSSSTAIFTNTILAGNTAPVSPDGAGIDFISLDYNLIGNPANMQISGRVSHNLVNVDPRLGPLAFNGGLTRTHELLDGSPAIDAGLSKFSTDQRGSPRSIDNPAITNIADGDASDIGAYEAPVYEVNSTADTDDGACTLPGKGNGCTLREAINAANAAPGAPEITFKASLTASGPTSINLSAGLRMSNDMTITGPGADLLTVQRSTAPGTFEFRVFEVLIGSTVTISNLTIANGVAIGPNAGGGIRNKWELTLNNCNLYGNSAVPADVGVGGAIYNEGRSLTLNNCNIGGLGPGQPNHAGAFGGGIATALGTVVMNGGSIVGNTGAGIAVISDTTLNGVSITNNTSSSSGAGVLVIGGLRLIENCLIANNFAGAQGGGIYSQFGITAANTTISGNRSTSNGGGVFVLSGQSTLTNVTVTNNRSDSDGNSSGAENGGGLAGALLLRNSIVTGNAMGSDANPTANDISQAMDPLSSFNLIGVCDGCNLINGGNHNQFGVSNAGLGALADNGGPTLTHALLPGSPALDAGANAFIAAPLFPGPPFADQRGFNRIADGPDADVTDTVDIGAVEQQVALTQIADAVMNEDTELIVPFEVGDRSGITSITATSSNQAVVPSNANHLNVTDAGSAELIIIDPARDQNGTTNITVTVNTTSGSSSHTFAVTVNPVNDAPSFDLSIVIPTLEDSGPVTAAVASNLSAGPTDEAGQSLSFQVISNSNPALFAVLPAINSSGNLTYTPAPDTNGTAIIKVVAKDNGGTANGGQDTSAPQTFTITIDPVNDPPVNHLPPQQSVAENNILTFSTANSNSITISDIDAGSAVVEVSLTVNNGVLTLGNPAGLTFLIGDGTADAKMQFRSTIANINAALNGLAYTPNQGFSGSSTLEITTNDLGATGAGATGQDTDFLNIQVVENAPVLLTEEGVQRAVALDSVTQTRDPFSLLNFFNFSNDHRRRISLFVWRLGLLPTDTAANLTVTAEDDQGHVYPLTVEFVGMLDTPPDVAQINVVLPDSVAGAPRDLWVRVQLHGPASNKASIAIAAP